MPPLPRRSSGLGLPTALPIATPIAQPLTNIDTTVPPVRPLTEPPQRFQPGAGPPGEALPVALPVARFEGEEPGKQFIAADPQWTSRWQPSATPPNQPRPWVVGYRWWASGVRYESWGPDPLFRIDLWWRNGHRRAFAMIPRSVWLDFRNLHTSVGRWFHKTLLGPGWKPGRGSLYPDWEL